MCYPPLTALDCTPLGFGPRAMSRQAAILRACAAARHEDDPIGVELLGDASELDRRASEPSEYPPSQEAVNQALTDALHDYKLAVEQFERCEEEGERGQADYYHAKAMDFLNDYDALLELGLAIARGER